MKIRACSIAPKRAVSPREKNLIGKPNLRIVKWGWCMKTKHLILKTIGVGIAGWAVSFSADATLKAVHASPFWANYLDDVIVGIVAAFAYWFHTQYQAQIINRRMTLAYLDDAIRNALQVVLLAPDDDLVREVAMAAERISRALLAARLQTDGEEHEKAA
jgi:hypothetical protein